MSTPAQAYIVGTGPKKVICLHGWFGHARNWGGLPNQLDGQAFTYAFIDYQGYGTRLNDKGPFTLAQIARDTLAAADQLGWSTFSLVGHSMGGSAIQYVLAEAPERVKSLVGITPVPASGVPFDDDGWALFSSAATDPQARRAILDFTSGHLHGNAWLDSMVASTQQNSSPEAVAGYLDAWAKTDFASRIQGKTLPVLVLVGQHDPALSEDFCRNTWMQYYPNASLQVMATSGHYPMDAAPQELATKIEDFLRAHA